VRDPRHLQRGVVRFVRERVQPGYNLHTSRRWTEAWLVDLEGRNVHTWKLPPPDASELSPLTAMFSGWQHVELGDDGDLYVIVELGRLLRLDRDSRVEWIL